jgi:hypothetical protein
MKQRPKAGRIESNINFLKRVISATSRIVKKNAIGSVCVIGSCIAPLTIDDKNNEINNICFYLLSLLIPIRFIIFISDHFVV